MNIRIQDFCKTGSGGTPDRSRADYYNGDIPWVKSGELREGTICSTEEKITRGALIDSSAKMIPAGSLLIAMYGATVGRTAILGISAATNQAVCNIQPDPNRCDTRYLFHFLRSKMEHFVQRAAGGAQPNISQGIIRETKVPLPSLDQQRRIVAILDKADALRRKRKRALELLDGLTQSIFIDMFGNPSTNLKKIKLGRIGDLLEDTQYGTSARAGNSGRYPILRMRNITNNGMILTEELKYIDIKSDELDRYTVKKGDILFNRTNSVELVGKTAVFQSNDTYAYAGYLVRARVRKDAAPEYVSGYLNSPHGKATLRGMAKSIVGMANINAREMQNIPILLPPKCEQFIYQARVNAIAQKFSNIIESKKVADQLFASIQQKAFSGTL